MRKAEDLMSEYKISKNDEFLVEDSELSEQEKSKILNLALSKIEAFEGDASNFGETDKVIEINKIGGYKKMELNNKKRPGPKKIIALAAALVLCLGTASAFAGGYINISDTFKSIFGFEDPDIEGESSTLDIVCENNGWKAIFKEVLGDSNSAYVLFDIVAPEGTVLADTSFLMGGTIDFPTANLAGGGWCYDVLTDLDVPNDNVVPMMLSVGCSKGLQGKTLGIHLQDFVGYTPKAATDSSEINDEAEIDEGFVETHYEDVDFSAEIPMNYKITTVTHKINGKFKANEKDFMVKSAEISPLSVKLLYNDYPNASSNYDYCDQLKIYLKDGSIIEDYRGSSGSSGFGTHMEIFELERSINPRDVIALEVYGSKFNFE